MGSVQYKDVANKSTLIGDEAAASEAALMAEYYRCEAAMRDVIAKVNRTSMFATIDAEAFENLCHDEMPDHDSWQQTIQEASRG